MLTEQQFQKMIEVIGMNQQDRERLIRMETMMLSVVQNEGQCKTDTACKIESIRVAANKAHERIDMEERARIRIVSIFGGVVGFGSVILLILRLTGHI